MRITGRSIARQLRGNGGQNIAKLACNRAGFNAASEALQVMGATGYSSDSLVEYCLRRCRGWMVAGGSIEILQNRIAEAVFERSFSQRPERP